MTEPSQISFNLWSEPWIDLERSDGRVIRLGLRDTLVRAADELVAIFDPSPLAVAGIHRLLTAILQDIHDPQGERDLRELWTAGRFAPKRIAAFGEAFASRFDLFSESAPFMQTSDVGIHPSRDDPVKTVAYLAPNMPSGTGIIHYRHANDEAQIFCPPCAAKGLTIIPAFATTGGAGIKPSINGVPPVYVLPGGRNLFEKLFCSLMLPGSKPRIAARELDQVWWRREAIVSRSHELLQVGYLHSLTFPARRVRLHPQKMHTTCTLCGAEIEVGVKTMVFEMGEMRPRESEFWQDPFAGYTQKAGKLPTPVRPQRGKALWREFGGLFLSQRVQEGAQRVIRPVVVSQAADLAVEGIGTGSGLREFRCIGLLTDMKAKIFEWVDADFSVSTSLLEDEYAGQVVEDALTFSQDCMWIIKDVFKRKFGGAGKGAARYSRVRQDMEDRYWSNLSHQFRTFILELGPNPSRIEPVETWKDMVIAAAKSSFAEAVESTGDDAVTLRRRVEAEMECNGRLNARRRKE